VDAKVRVKQRTVSAAMGRVSGHPEARQPQTEGLPMSGLFGNINLLSNNFGGHDGRHGGRGHGRGHHHHHHHHHDGDCHRRLKRHRRGGCR
jgi:hypothetical protein